MIRHKYWVIAIVLLLVGGDAAYWRFAAERLHTGYQEWLAERAAEGWEVGSGPTSIGGWPRAATVAVPNLILRHTGPAVPGDLELASTGVTLSVSLFRPTHLRISIRGPTHVRSAGMPDIVLTGNENWISVLLQESDSHSIDLHASSLRIEPATKEWHATAGLLNAHATIASKPDAEKPGANNAGAGDADAAQSRPAATFSVNAETIALPSVVKWPLGTNLSSLSLEGDLNGPLPSMLVLNSRLSSTHDITGWAEAWRDGGGSLAITRLAMEWGPLSLTSSATLALDDQLQPMGSGNGRFVGYAAALDRLVAGGTLTKSAATAAKAILSLMAGTAEADEPSAVDVPLTLQYRTLSMRQVPLIRLPELDWPAQ